MICIARSADGRQRVAACLQSASFYSHRRRVVNSTPKAFELLTFFAFSFLLFSHSSHLKFIVNSTFPAARVFVYLPFFYFSLASVYFSFVLLVFIVSHPSHDPYPVSLLSKPLLHYLQQSNIKIDLSRDSTSLHMCVYLYALHL